MFLRQMGHSHMRLEQSQQATRWKQGMKTTSRSFSRQTQHLDAVSRRDTSPETAVEAAASASESSIIESPGYRSGPGSRSRSASTTLGRDARGALAERVHHAAEYPAEAAFRLAARPGRVAALFSHVYGLDLYHPIAVVEPHEDALSFKAANFPALAVEGRVAAQAAELDPHRSASRPRMTP